MKVEFYFDTSLPEVDQNDHVQFGLDENKTINFSSEQTTTNDNIKSIGLNDMKDEPLLSQEIKFNYLFVPRLWSLRQNL